MSYWGQMTSTASIVAPTTTTDDANVVAPAWTSAAASSRCTPPQPIRGEGAQTEFARRLNADFVIYVPRETNIGPSILADAQRTGQQWKVTIDSVAYYSVYVLDAAGKGRVKKVYLRYAA